MTPRRQEIDVELLRDPTAPGEVMRMLAEFHEHPNALGEGTNTQALRRTLHQEEHAELMHELLQAAGGSRWQRFVCWLLRRPRPIADFEQIARELADVVYVAYGSAWAFHIDLDAALREVHRAAMDKMNAGHRRADGKILKPPGFRPPDMSEAVRRAA
jgi:predicted HAD superfamily Cof-like phosphohydrolase